MQSVPPDFVPRYSNRQVVYATLCVAAACLLFYILYRFSWIVFILFVAIMLATAIRPIVDWLNRRGLPRPVGVIAVYITLMCLTAGFIVLLIPLISGQIEAITTNLPAYYDHFRGGLIQSPSRILQQIAIQMPLDLILFNPGTQTGGGETIGRVAQSLPFVNIFSRGLFITIAVFILGFGWIVESDRLIRNALLWMPPDRRDSIRELITQIEEKVGGFLLGQGFLCLVVGIMALLAYLVIGLPFALVLAAIAGILEAVPIFGPILGAVPALMIALSTDPSKALWVVVATILIQELENHLLVPRVMKRSVGVNSLVTLLSLLAFTSLLGLMGAVLAIPLAAILQLFLDRFVLTPVQTEVKSVDGRDQISRLRYETQEFALDVRKQLRENEQIDGSEQELVDELEAIAAELDLLLSRSEQAEEVA
jgi:predicted PurR-regulated permease PerM